MEKEYPPEVGKKKKKKPLFAICATFVRNFNAFYAPLPLPAPPLSRRNTQTHAGRDCGVLNGPLTPRSRSTETSATIFPLRRERPVAPLKFPSLTSILSGPNNRCFSRRLLFSPPHLRFPLDDRDEWGRLNRDRGFAACRSRSFCSTLAHSTDFPEREQVFIPREIL